MNEGRDTSKVVGISFLRVLAPHPIDQVSSYLGTLTAPSKPTSPQSSYGSLEEANVSLHRSKLNRQSPREARVR